MRLSDLVSEKEMIRNLGVCRKTFLRYLDAGLMPFYQIGPRRKYNPEEVEAAFLEKKVNAKIN